MSLCHFGQQLFVLLVGWVSWPIVGRRQDGKRVNGFGILPIFRNIRLASLDEFVILGFHVFVLLVELGVFVNCGPPGRVGLGCFWAGVFIRCPRHRLVLQPTYWQPRFGLLGVAQWKLS